MISGARVSRSLAICLAILGLSASLVSAQELARPPMRELAPTYNSEADKEQIAAAQEAYIWGYPLVQTGEYHKLGEEANIPKNRLIVTRDIITGAYAPAAELLYGFAYLDLSNGPVLIAVPDTNGRYFSLQLVDAYGNSFAYISKRTQGPKGGTYAVVGPGWDGKLDRRWKRIDAPQNEIVLQSRTFVAGPEDLDAANTVLDGYKIVPASAGLKNAPIPMTNPRIANLWPMLRFPTYGPEYFDLLSDRLIDNPAPPIDTDRMARFAKIGIGPGKRPSETADSHLLQNMRDGMRLGENVILTTDFATHTNGWAVIYGVDGAVADPTLRAFIQRYGLGFHIADEGLYYIKVAGPHGDALTGKKNYKLHFPADKLPKVDGFWSINMMRVDQFLEPNDFGRYSIGGHTEGLKYNDDGSLDLYIEHDRPKRGTSNWLPSPDGDFRITLRLYEPLLDETDGRYDPPELEIFE